MLKLNGPQYLNEIFVTKNFVRDTRGSSDIFILADHDFNGCKFDYNSIAKKMVNNWNSLPASLRHLENLEKFKIELKTFYFKTWLYDKGL